MWFMEGWIDPRNMVLYGLGWKGRFDEGLNRERYGLRKDARSKKYGLEWSGSGDSRFDEGWSRDMYGLRKRGLVLDGLGLVLVDLMKG